MLERRIIFLSFLFFRKKIESQKKNVNLFKKIRPLFKKNIKYTSFWNLKGRIFCKKKYFLKIRSFNYLKQGIISNKMDM